MSKCHADGCNNEIFSHNFCRYHGYMRRMKGGDLYNKAKSTSNKPVEARSFPEWTNIPPKSKKRLKDEKTYSEQINLFWDESVANKTDFCFFCGVHMVKQVNIHHWRGRTGDYYLDKRYWSNAHNECHLNHHMKSIGWLMQQPYYPSFLARLKTFDIESYNKERKREEKAQLNLDYD